MFNKLNKNLIAVVVLTVIWIIMLILVNPIGDFPLNDDWAWGRDVYNFLNEGRISFTGWEGMTLIAQILWGALFCLPFGFSFTALRFSTLVLGLVGVLATYFVFREIKASTIFSFLAACVVMFNPIYFELSNTFMTDVPFFAVSMLSLLFFLKWIEKGGRFELIFCLFLALVSIFIRQIGVVLLAGFGVALLLKRGVNRKNIISAIFLPVLGLGLLLLYETIINSTIGLPSIYSYNVKVLFTNAKKSYLIVLMGFIKNLIAMFIYLGFFLFPVLLLSFVFVWKKIKRFFWCMGGIIILSWYYLIPKFPQSMPLLGNVYYNFILGPLTLRDSYFFSGVSSYYNFPDFLGTYTLLNGIIGGGIIASLFIYAIKKKNWLALMAIFIVFAYFLPLGLSWLFDRYLIFLIPFVMIVVYESFKDKIKSFSFPLFFSFLLLICFAFLSVVGTHDYLSWNRARWKALNYLTEDLNISYKEIDGGFEFNGWHGFDPHYKPPKDKSWWWVYDDKYVITFGPLPGYTKMKTFQFKRWFPLGYGNIYIAKRIK